MSGLYGFLASLSPLLSMFTDGPVLTADTTSNVDLCVYCRAVPATVNDHVQPKCKGGTNRSSNLLSACTSCNSSKGGRYPSEWLESILRKSSPMGGGSIGSMSLLDRQRFVCLDALSSHPNFSPPSEDMADACS